MPMKVLMVCTGNICRSPMAEVMLRDALARRGVADVEVASAGTWAGEGNEATFEARAAMTQRGLDLAAHRSTPLERAHLEEADLIVAMTSVHLRELDELAPESRRKTLLIKEIAELKLGRVPDQGSREERLASLLKARRPAWRRALDLDDPIGLPEFAYVRCAEQIEIGVEKLADALAGPGQTAKNASP